MVEQERQTNLEEIERIKADAEYAIQQNETKLVILKNKLVQLANNSKVYVCFDFSLEMIVDALLEKINYDRPKKSRGVMSKAESYDKLKINKRRSSQHNLSKRRFSQESKEINNEKHIKTFRQPKIPLEQEMK